MIQSRLFPTSVMAVSLLAACRLEPNQFLELNFDPQVTLATGFDNTGRYGVVTGVSNEFECVGWFPEEPGHVMILMGPFSGLTVRARKWEKEDLLLMIRFEDDTYCADADDPQITLDSWPAGTYEIFVGTVEPNIEVYYTVEFIE